MPAHWSVMFGVRMAGADDIAAVPLFILTKGRAEVTGQGDKLGELGPGDFFGEIAILDGGRRTATVTTTAPSKLLVMFGTEFRRLQQEQPEVASRIEDAMRQHVATAD